MLVFPARCPVLAFPELSPALAPEQARPERPSNEYQTLSRPPPPRKTSCTQATPSEPLKTAFRGAVLDPHSALACACGLVGLPRLRHPAPPPPPALASAAQKGLRRSLLLSRVNPWGRRRPSAPVPQTTRGGRVWPFHTGAMFYLQSAGLKPLPLPPTFNQDHPTKKVPKGHHFTAPPPPRSAPRQGFLTPCTVCFLGELTSARVPPSSPTREICPQYWSPMVEGLF